MLRIRKKNEIALNIKHTQNGICKTAVSLRSTSEHMEKRRQKKKDYSADFSTIFSTYLSESAQPDVHIASITELSWNIFTLPGASYESKRVKTKRYIKNADDEVDSCSCKL